MALLWQPVNALEGGVTSDEGWDNKTENQPVTEEQKAEEQKQRKAAIAADIERLKKTPDHCPSPELTEKLQ